MDHIPISPERERCNHDHAGALLRPRARPRDPGRAAAAGDPPDARRVRPRARRGHLVLLAGAALRLAPRPVRRDRPRPLLRGDRARGAPGERPPLLRPAPRGDPRVAGQRADRRAHRGLDLFRSLGAALQPARGARRRHDGRRLRGPRRERDRRVAAARAPRRRPQRARRVPARHRRPARLGGGHRRRRDHLGDGLDARRPDPRLRDRPAAALGGRAGWCASRSTS